VSVLVSSVCVCSDSLFFLPILVRGFLLYISYVLRKRGFLLYISYVLRKRFTLLMIFVDYVCVCVCEY
jgi:hypothetical protein